MAEDKKDDPSYEFAPPDFDEEAFIHKELVSFRTTAILFVWGIVAAAASWAAFAAVGGAKSGWFIGLALCAAFGYALRFLFPRLGADVSHFKRREWTGTGFLFFFTWLSFFMLAINPPLTDVAPPQLFVHAAPPIQEAGGAVRLDVLATDNDRVSGLQVQATRDGAPLTVDFHDGGANHRVATLGNAAPGRYTVTATATDPKGHATVRTGNFTVGPTLDMTWPAGNALAKPDDHVLVKIGAYPPCDPKDPGYKGGFACIRTVSLNRTDVARTAEGVALEYSDQFGGWLATANFKGWTPGNHTVQAIAQFPDTFLGAERVGGGEIASRPAAIDMRLPPGDHTVAVLPQPSARAVLVPGPGLGLTAIGLLGLALFLRRGR